MVDVNARFSNIELDMVEKKNKLVVLGQYIKELESRGEEF